MHSKLLSFLIIIQFLAISITAQTSPIRINQIGYEKNGPKTAVYESSSSSENLSEYNLLDSQSTVVKTGSVTKVGAVDGWSGRYFWTIDFSDFKDEGKYKLQVGSETSFEFEIKENIYFTKTLEGLLFCFEKMRSTDESDKNIPLAPDKTETVNVYGGYNEASGDDSKHITHLQYSNFMCSQETPMLTWGLMRAYELNKDQIESMALKTDLFDEVAWGADYLMRSLHADGYFYSTVFNGWGLIDRIVCAYAVVDLDADKFNITGDYQTAFREGGGTAIAALAKASKYGVSGDFTSAEYLAGAIKAYDHIKANNISYCDNGEQNLLDEYAACIAAIELFKATDDSKYLTDAGEWVEKILARMTDEGWFAADDAHDRPYFHAAEEGFPFVALAYYMTLDNSKNSKIREVLEKNIEWYFKISNEVTNPFNYARLYARSFESDDNLALNKDIWSLTAEEDMDNPDLYAVTNANDGNQASFWLSKEKTEEVDKTDWVAIDFGQEEEIYKVVINWEWQYAKKYIIQTSTDGDNWDDEVTIEISESGPMETVFDQKITTRYIRVFCSELAGDHPDKTGYGIHEFEVYKENNNSFFTKNFFIPHENETGYWWQGENARLGSMAAGLLWAAKALDDNYKFGADSLTTLAFSQLDWILGKNPYEVCMLYGYGTKNHEDYKPDPNSSKGSIVGGICNGITAGNTDEKEVDFAPYPSGEEGWKNWRWLEQWLPHEAWFMFAVSSISYIIRDEQMTDIQSNNIAPKSKAISMSCTQNQKIFNIRFNSFGQTLKNSTLKIMDLKGRTVKRVDLSGDENIISLSKSTFSSGLYFLELKTPAKQHLKEKISILK